MSASRRIPVPVVIAAMAALVALFSFRVFQLANRGDEVNWLAELWWPTAVLSIGLVTCADLLMKPAPGQKSPVKALRSRPARPRGA